MFYQDENKIPGICVDRGDKSFSWSPAKFSRSIVKVGTESTDNSDLDVDDCVCIDYQPRVGVTRNDCFLVTSFL